jgi:CheY-like chemotaxis protein
MVVLVVEDEFLITMWVEETLLEAGHQVISAVTADQAMEVLNSRQDVRLLFTDVNMPGSMDGIQLASTVRERWPNIKIIVASGRQIVQGASLPPASVFLPKPYLPKDILGAIAAVA